MIELVRFSMQIVSNLGFCFPLNWGLLNPKSMCFDLQYSGLKEQALPGSF